MRGVLRSRVFWAISVPLAVLGVYLAFAVFGVHTLFYDETVNEEFAVEARSATGGQMRAGSESNASSDQMSRSDSSRMSSRSRENGRSNQMSNSDGSNGPVAVSSGKFHSVAHPGMGDAIVYRLEGGSHVLRLENLDVFNGPDLYVYAVAARDANDSDSVLDAEFLNLGELKGNQGNQTYQLPTGFDPAKHRSISVWCQRFSVNFATAPLG